MKDRYFKCEECSDYFDVDDLEEIKGQELCKACFEKITINDEDSPVIVRLRQLLIEKEYLKEIEGKNE